MYIHWSHHYLPKLFGILSFVCNPIFICLIATEKKASIGKYRYLLIGFAIFDMAYSTVELIVPVAIHGTGAAFVIYLADGPFFGTGKLGQLAVSIRCGCISLSYGILVIHFIYRYLVLFNTRIIDRLLRPSGLFGLFVFFVFHGIAWSSVCEMCLYGDQEVFDYIYDAFQKDYHVDSHDLSMLMALFFDASPEIKRRSWIGILLLTGISIYAISLYVILGWKIMKKLADNPGVSATTQKLHRQLFKALAVQTFIPICISFSPCMMAWYGPVIGLDLGMWNNYLGVIALSAFPVLDPLAIIFLLPNYRNKLFRTVKMPIKYFYSGTSTVRPNVDNSAQVY
ncbi:Serpentine Receptor, class J [Caenorhabditis elegans]|uniref:Serpentine Receptor, class J n=1 Tax=Caenorhabditis elegans TaxID=6239 RepID=P91504_CAEEL|nr:Serpentine Receptor, class J [Caenorhabditis elegans]CCD70569.1 Serpentine Receptor, class J [Caenorhabditis elegans]|eukprot:NP_503888.1 Serpentine Receptor, class J [Caenorhabditis elegans]